MVPHLEEPMSNGVNGVNGHHMSKHQFDSIEDSIAAFGTFNCLGRTLTKQKADIASWQPAVNSL